MPEICKWKLITGKNRGKKCKKQVCHYGSKYCIHHVEKGNKKDLEERDLEYIKKYGLNYDEYIKKQFEDAEAKFVEEYGMSRKEYEELEKEKFIQEKEKQNLEYVEKQNLEKERQKNFILEEIKKDPNYQIKEMQFLIHGYLKGFFDPNDGYMDLVRAVQVEATPDGIITLSDGRKYKVDLVEK